MKAPDNASGGFNMNNHAVNLAFSFLPVKRASLYLALLVLGASAWTSGEPWIEKPYQQWNENDVVRVLTASPWSRMATVKRTWRKVGAENLPEGALSGGRRRMPTELGESNDAMIGNDVNFGVFWMSSRVTRAATARRAALQSRMDEAAAEKYIKAPQAEYELVVQGSDMTPFANKDEKFFRENASLQMRKTKLILSPTRVQYELSQDKKSVYAVKFYFLKNLPSGEPSIAPDERNATFICALEASALRVEFELTKMVDRSGLAL
jgi:hypothetical protein